MEIIKLNLIPSGVNPTCHVKQYDKGRIIRFELFNGLTPYTLQSGDTVTLNLRKPDNTIIEASVTATQGNKYVDLVTTEQMCAVAGYNLGTFKIVNGETDIGTINFIMEVGKDVLANGIPSQSQIEDLEELVREAVGDDYYTKSETNDLLDGKADSDEVYTKTEVDSAFNLKADKSTVESIEEKISDNKISPFAVVDASGKAALEIDKDGITKIKQKHFEQDANGLHNKNENGELVTDYKTTDVYDFVVCDQNNRILFYVKDGKLVVNEIKANLVYNPNVEKLEKNSEKLATSKSANFDSELNMFIAYGQSWSVGYDAPAISLTPQYDNIMFNTGIKNDPLTDTTITPTSFVPMVEYTGTSSGSGSQTCGETPVSAMCNTIKQLIQSENGYSYTDFPYQLLGNAPGMGDKTLAELKKGTTWYNRLISQVGDAFTIASNLGKKLVVQAFSWQQLALGSGITTTYAEALEQLRLDIDSDVKAITGQTQDVKCITWQTFNRSATGAAECYDKYVGAAETYPNIICSGASYQFKHVANNNLHLLAPDNDWAGAYFGVAYKRTIIDGVKFVPLKPISASLSGKDCILTFNVPQKPLVFDTDTVASIANKGFTLLESEGTEKTITSVDIIAPDKIRIRASENILTTDRIAYGQNAGSAFGPVNGNRGNVRDSQGNYITYTAGNGEIFAIHNWLVIFDKVISTLINN